VLGRPEAACSSSPDDGAEKQPPLWFRRLRSGYQRVREFEEELLRRRRDHLILRVDRADLSKNVLRGFSAFDTFLEQHPEFRERVTFIAQLLPSRTDVPEYAEYLERIEALVAVVNHRHGTPDWMPIQLKLRDNLEEAVAAYQEVLKLRADDVLALNNLAWLLAVRDGRGEEALSLIERAIEVAGPDGGLLDTQGSGLLVAYTMSLALMSAAMILTQRLRGSEQAKDRPAA